MNANALAPSSTPTPCASEAPRSSAALRIARARFRRLVRLAIRVVAALYLVGLWVDGVGSDLVHLFVPSPLAFFMNAAALFTEASGAVTEYRAEAWLCEDRRWAEIDTRAYFPMHPDDKENRFQRALQFYRDQPAVTRALNEYLVERHGAGGVDDGLPRAKIGGVRLLRVTSPIPSPGGRVERYVHQPLSAFPSAARASIYESDESALAERCGHTPTRKGAR